MSKRSNVARSGGRRWLAAFAGVLGVLMFSTGLSLVVQGGSNAAPSAYPSNKVWVCKFVTDPKGVTRLKTGNDGLVDVSINALKGFHGLGSLFDDKHVKSIAVAWGNTPKPQVAIVNGVCAVVTSTPTPTPTTTSASPSTSASSSTPSGGPSSVTPSTTTSVPSSSSPSSSAHVVIPSKVHSGLESLSPLGGSGSPAERELGLGLAGLGSVLMIGSMGLLRRTAKR